jgi:hypothetical protein
MEEKLLVIKVVIRISSSIDGRFESIHLFGNSKVFLVPQNFNFLINLSLILNSHTKVFFSIRVLQSQQPNRKPLT